MNRQIAFISVLFHYVLAQDLNILPNLLRPYATSVDQYVSINFMANVSEKFFHAQRIGLSFGQS